MKIVIQFIWAHHPQANHNFWNAINLWWLPNTFIRKFKLNHRLKRPHIKRRRIFSKVSALEISTLAKTLNSQLPVKGLITFLYNCNQNCWFSKAQIKIWIQRMKIKLKTSILLKTILWKWFSSWTALAKVIAFEKPSWKLAEYPQ